MPAESDVGGLVNLSHATGAETRGDLIVFECAANHRSIAASGLVDDRLCHQILELALHFLDRRLHHQHADELFLRIHEEVGALGA